MASNKKRNLNPTGLGRAIINKKVKDAQHARETRMYTTDVDSTSKLRSVTQEKDLDEFLNTAQLAGTEFTAERQNVTIIQTPSASASTAHNPFLLTDVEERQTLRRHLENKSRLRVPRRPPWKKGVSLNELERHERDSFLDWRRGLAQLQEEENLLLTPFERNIEVWRQLWRVLERSHLVVQIVDARNPLRFRCEDLEAYLRDIEGPEGEAGSGPCCRKSLLLINKADLLTAAQRRMWADHFDKVGVEYAFFSAANAVALQRARREVTATGQEDGDDPIEDHELSTSGNEGLLVDDAESDGELDGPAEPPGSDGDEGTDSDISDEDERVAEHMFFSDEEDSDDADDADSRTKVLTVLELEELFLKTAPTLDELTVAYGSRPEKLVVGLVGYPNVGKSSTINSLLGEKKVSVSSTPGKTKHFQTIHLSQDIVLCDCPGLVFPQFATTKADLVCDGVLPIDQLREYTGPTSLVVQRIPKSVLEAVYGLTIRMTSIEEGGDGKVKADDFLIAYAIARGYARSGQGNPDEARAARYILKDYVNGKLLYCHAPPGISDNEFNEKTQALTLKRLQHRKRAPVTRVGKNADTYIGDVDNVSTVGSSLRGQGRKARAIDESFFKAGGTLSSRPFVQGTARHGQEFTRGRTYPHQNSVTDDGQILDGRRARVAAVLAAAGTEGPGKGKKHFKGNKRVKQRSGKGYD